MKISVVIPAHNEEKYIERCINSIREAEKLLDEKVEVIVVLNRCTDRTEELASNSGAIVYENNERCIAKVRNEGMKKATGEIIVTIDGDSLMTKETLKEIKTLILSGEYVGGGALIEFDRKSFPLKLTQGFINLSVKITKAYSCIFWSTKANFESVGYFDENILLGEDLDMAKKLKLYGKRLRKKYTCLKNGKLITSSRKFDYYGDWFSIKLLFLEFKRIKAMLQHGDRAFVDEYFYDFKHEKLD